MSKKDFMTYMVRVVSYVRMEWSLVREGEPLEISMTKDMETLLRDCFGHGVSVPNAARDVRTFMDMDSKGASK